MPVEILVSGRHACFTRPEMKVERVSYEVITPSAARGILDSIYWQPCFRWVVERISILNPIKFQTISRNEIGAKAPSRKARTSQISGKLGDLGIIIEENRQQRASTVLKDVAYLINAKIELTLNAQMTENVGKHLNIFRRRARNGRCFCQPYLGTREFPASFTLVENNTPSYTPIHETRNLGLMLLDVDYMANSAPIFFEAKLNQGILIVPDPALLNSGQQ